jgi:hypothetical protein
MPNFYSVVELEIDATTIQSNSLLANVLKVDELFESGEKGTYPTLRALLDSHAGSWSTKIESVEREDDCVRILFLGSSCFFEPVRNLMIRLADIDNTETIRSFIRYVTPYRYGYAELVGRKNGISWSVSRNLSEALPDGEIPRLLLKNISQASSVPQGSAQGQIDWQQELVNTLYEVIYPEPNEASLDILKATGSIQLHPLYKFWFNRTSDPNLTKAFAAHAEVMTLEKSWDRHMPDWAAKWAHIRALSKEKDCDDPDLEDVRIDWSVCQ